MSASVFSPRHAVGSLLVMNFLFLLATYPICSIVTGAGKLHVMSSYRELADKADDGGELTEDTDSRWDIPDAINAGAFKFTKMAAVGVATAFFINVVILGMVFIASAPARGE